MKKYLYNYQTTVRFDGDIGSHSVKLRCLPCNNSCQKVVREEIIFHPSHFWLHEGTDIFGNRTLHGGTTEAHRTMVYVSCGIVELDWYRIPDSSPEPFYLVQSEKTHPSAKMLSLPFTPQGNALEDANELCHLVHANMQYAPFSTLVTTNASDAFDSGMGVCQDYSHILISLCRHYGIPARYVNGFIDGEGETHAWVEIYDGEAWMGIDPTHDCQICMGYIKIAHGRDADDCSVSRGCYMGCKHQSTDIKVVVTELE